VLLSRCLVPSSTS